jgi:hypothetical protein
MSTVTGMGFAQTATIIAQTESICLAVVRQMLERAQIVLPEHIVTMQTIKHVMRVEHALLETI